MNIDAKILNKILAILAEAVTLMAVSTYSSCRGLHGLQPTKTVAAIRWRRLRWGRGLRCFKAWARPVGDRGEGCVALRDTAPSLSPALSSPDRPEAGGPGGPGEKGVIRLLRAICHEDHSQADHWWSGDSNRRAQGLAIVIKH